MCAWPEWRGESVCKARVERRKCVQSGEEEVCAWPEWNSTPGYLFDPYFKMADPRKHSTFLSYHSLGSFLAS